MNDSPIRGLNEQASVSPTLSLDTLFHFLLSLVVQEKIGLLFLTLYDCTYLLDTIYYFQGNCILAHHLMCLILYVMRMFKIF